MGWGGQERGGGGVGAGVGWVVAAPTPTAFPQSPPTARRPRVLQQDPIYVGGKHRRVRGDAYFELVDEFLTAVRRRYGNSVLIDFAGMDYETQVRNAMLHSFLLFILCRCFCNHKS